jgi:hypothetical protein
MVEHRGTRKLPLRERPMAIDRGKAREMSDGRNFKQGCKSHQYH